MAILHDYLINRPSPGVPDRFFFAIDEGRLYRDDLTLWTLLTTPSQFPDHPKYIERDGNLHVGGQTPMESVDSLPVTVFFGRIVYLTTDNHLYVGVP